MAALATAEPLFFSANVDLVLRTNQIIQNDPKHSNIDLPRARVELHISDSRTGFVAVALDARSESQCLDYAACPAINDRVGATKLLMVSSLIKPRTLGSYHSSYIHLFMFVSQCHSSPEHNDFLTAV
jgi:hypothetical protein